MAKKGNKSKNSNRRRRKLGIITGALLSLLGAGYQARATDELPNNYREHQSSREYQQSTKEEISSLEDLIDERKVRIDPESKARVKFVPLESLPSGISPSGEKWQVLGRYIRKNIPYWLTFSEMHRPHTIYVAENLSDFLKENGLPSWLEKPLRRNIYFHEQYHAFGGNNEFLADIHAAKKSGILLLRDYRRLPIAA